MDAKGTGGGPGMRAMAALGLATLLTPLNSTMVAVALPDIRSEFGVGVIAVTWLVTGYLVAVAVSQPIGGRLGDAVGHLRILKAGLAIMAVFSVLSAVSPTYELLVVTRSIQGVASALLVPNATAYLRRAVPVRRLGGAMGTNGAFTAAGAAAGPVVGGLLLVLGDWQLLFLANLPIAALAMLLIAGLREAPGRGIDWAAFQAPSIAALTAAFAGLALLGTSFRSGSAALVAVASVVCLAGCGAYVAWFRRRGSGIVDLRLFSRRVYASAAALTSLSNLVMYTSLIAIPVFLRDEHGYGAAAIGAILFAMSATMAALSFWGGRLGDRLGLRRVLVSGALALLVSAAGVAFAFATGSIVLLVVALAVMGTGVGLATPAQQTSALAAWPPSVAGSAAGTLSLMRYVGSVTGASLFAAVLGSSPGVGDYNVLMAAVVAVAVANLMVALVPLEREAPEAAVAPA